MIISKFWVALYICYMWKFVFKSGCQKLGIHIIYHQNRNNEMNQSHNGDKVIRTLHYPEITINSK